jgi:hypothetical protein
MSRCENPKRVAFGGAVCKHGMRQRRGGNRSTLWGAARLSITCRAWEARERRPSEILVKAIAGVPWKGETQGRLQRSAGQHLVRSPGTLGRAKAQKPGPIGPARRFGGGDTARLTVCGFFRVVTPRIPSERGNLRRVNPKSAAGVKQNRRGTEGRKPSRG